MRKPRKRKDIWVDWAMELQFLAQTGLTYTKSIDSVQHGKRSVGGGRAHGKSGPPDCASGPQPA